MAILPSIFCHLKFTFQFCHGKFNLIVIANLLLHTWQIYFITNGKFTFYFPWKIYFLFYHVNFMNFDLHNMAIFVKMNGPITWQFYGFLFSLGHGNLLLLLPWQFHELIYLQIFHGKFNIITMENLDLLQWQFYLLFCHDEFTF